MTHSCFSTARTRNIGSCTTSSFATWFSCEINVDFRVEVSEIPGSLEPTSGGGQFGLAADDWQHWFTATNSQHLRQIVLPDHYLRRNPYLAVPAANAAERQIARHAEGATIEQIFAEQVGAAERVG